MKPFAIKFTLVLSILAAAAMLLATTSSAATSHMGPDAKRWLSGTIEPAAPPAKTCTVTIAGSLMTISC